MYKRILHKMHDKVRSRQYFMTLHAEEEMVCDNCGREGAHIRYVSRSNGKGADLLVIENIPVVTCPHCGESYLTADTLQEIERIKLHRKNFALERSVPVATYALTVNR